MILVAAAVASGLTACGGRPPGTLHSDVNDAWAFGIPANDGQVLTLATTAVRNSGNRSVTIESIRPLRMTGPARYLGAVVLTQPHIGFGEDLAERFPSATFARYGHRLPFTMRGKDAVGALALGFRYRLGVSLFRGIAVDYRESGHRYTATIAMGARLCAPAKKWDNRCGGVPFDSIPPAKVTSR